MSKFAGNLVGGLYAGIVSAAFVLQGLILLGFIGLLLVGKMGLL